MRKAKVLYKGEEAGILTQHDDGTFSFKYNNAWLVNDSKPAIGLTLPKTESGFQSEFLFPFFHNMLPEGTNKKMACKLNRIDAEDDFGLLMIIAKNDSIGAVRVLKFEDE